MDKFIQIGEKFGLEEEKLLEFVREQLKLEEEKDEKRWKLEKERRREEEEKEEKRRQLEEEREEKRRQLDEEKEERRRILEEDRRKEEEEKQKRRRREHEEREAGRQERDLRKLELEAELFKQREAIEAAKREHELELTRLGQGRNDTQRAGVRDDRAKAPKLPSFADGKDDLDAYLQQFERFATTAKWEKTGWASKLNSSVKLRQYTEGYRILKQDWRSRQLEKDYWVTAA